VTTQHNQRRHWSKGNIPEIHPANLPWCPRIPPVELHNKFWGKHLCGRLPRVCFVTKTLSLDEILKLSLVHPAIEHFFHFPLLFSFLNHWYRWQNDVIQWGPPEQW
jgi:hypothetical protein